MWREAAEQRSSRERAACGAAPRHTLAPGWVTATPRRGTKGGRAAHPLSYPLTAPRPSATMAEHRREEADMRMIPRMAALAVVIPVVGAGCGPDMQHESSVGELKEAVTVTPGS